MSCLPPFTFYRSCELNKSIYEATQLEKVYNVTELVENTTDFINEFRDDLANLTVDLSDIKYVIPRMHLLSLCFLFEKSNRRPRSLVYTSPATQKNSSPPVLQPVRIGKLLTLHVVRIN